MMQSTTPPPKANNLIKSPPHLEYFVIRNKPNIKKNIKSSGFPQLSVTRTYMLAHQLSPKSYIHTQLALANIRCGKCNAAQIPFFINRMRQHLY